MKVESCFINQLCTTYIPRGKWKLDDELWFHSVLVKQVIKVPVGFVTDFASVPRIPGIYWWFGGRANRPATVHDFLYANHLYDRKTADLIFLEALKADGYNIVTRRMMYWAVRLFGMFAYNRHKKSQPGQ